MTAKEFTTTHRRLTAAGFRTAAGHPKGTYVMPGYPGPILKVVAPLASREDLVELVYAWGYCEGRKDARAMVREAILMT